MLRMNKSFFLPLQGFQKWVIVAFIGSFSLLNSVHAQYCASSATSTFDSGCDEVIFNTISNNTASICATYSDFTTMSTFVTVGQTVPHSVTAGSCGGNYTKHGKTWIDYNQDGDFDDPGEEVFSWGPVTPATANATTVTIPFTALIGSTRMRVQVRETGTLASVTPCGTYTWGETEDYTIIINPSSPDDLGVTQIFSPTSGCNLSSAEIVTVAITNFGTNPQTGFDLGYILNGGTPVIEPYGTDTLFPAQTDTFTFTIPANLGTPGTYTLNSFGALVGDTVPVNDSSEITITAIPGVNSYPYIEDFEGGMGGWVSSGVNSSWAFGNPAKSTIVGAASGVNCFVTGGLGTGDYNGNEDSQVLGPCFDFSSLSNPWITMKIWWNSENSWDGAVLQASTDFGLTWEVVGNFGDPFNWYTDNSLNGNPGGQQLGWTGRNSTGNGSGGWVQAAHRLDGLAGTGSVRLRIAFGSDGSVHDDGFAFDDVFIGDGPVPDLGPDIYICAGDTVIIDGGIFDGYEWSNGPTTRFDTISSAGSVVVKVSDTLGFFGFDTVLVVTSFPLVTFGVDTNICPGDTLFLNASIPGASYVWQDGATDSIYPATTAGTYYVDLIDSVGCYATDTLVMGVNTVLPTVLEGDTTVCISDPVTLDPGMLVPGSSFLWSSGQTTQAILVNSPGEYWVEVTFPGGCGSRDTAIVDVLPIPFVALGPDRVACDGEVLNASNAGSTYSWSTGATTQTVTVLSSGTYSVTVTNSFGCVQEDEVEIILDAVPAVNLGPDQVVCNGATIVLDAMNPGNTYLWSTGASTQSITTSIPGLYIVQVTTPFGCQSQDQVEILESSTVVNLGPDLTICGDQVTFLNAGNPGNAYLWSSGETTQSIVVTSAGTYSVQVTDADGCIAEDEVDILQLPGLVAGIDGPSTGALFIPITFTDTTSPTPISWDWDFGDGTGATVQNPTHTFLAFLPYTVRLIVEDAAGCRDTAFHFININEYVGVEEADFANSVKVYPNPSHGQYQIAVEFFNVTDLELQVYDLSGQKIYREFHPMTFDFKGNLDLTGLSNGIYVLHLRADGKDLFKKLIKY